MYVNKHVQCLCHVSSISEQPSLMGFFHHTAELKAKTAKLVSILNSQFTFQILKFLSELVEQLKILSQVLRYPGQSGCTALLSPVTENQDSGEGVGR